MLTHGLKMKRLFGDITDLMPFRLVAKPRALAGYLTTPGEDGSIPSTAIFKFGKT